MKATDLIPDEANANRHTERGEKMVSDSIAKYNFRFAGTVDKNNRIVHGNNRYDKATKQGLDEAVLIEADPTKQYYLKFDDLDLTDPANPAREISIAANRTAQVSIDFDPATILAHLDAGVDLGQFWREDELQEILGELKTADGEDAEPQIDRAAELQAKWGTALGQVWQLGEHRLIVGDCTDKAVVEAVMRGERVDLVFTDPPYNVGITGGTHDPRDIKNYKSGRTIDNDNMIDVEFDNFLLRFMRIMDSNVMRPGCVFYLCAPAGRTETQFRNAIDKVFTLRQCLVWVKQQFVFGRQDYHWRHESILYGWKDGAAHYFTDDLTQDTVWEINRPMRSDKEHPTQKPIQLPEKAIMNSSRRGEIVYDPFVGSGTTIIACENLKRKCRAIEILPAYVGVTLQRWFDLTGKEPAPL